MKKPVTPPEGPKDIEKIELKDALEERYLAYALSTIMHRALPDVRDGLKPVHRRLLHVMRQLRLDPDSAFKKSAKIVGDVMGSFHPHGDQSIYDALVRLAQDFSSRYPLIDGQGNFGNVDGDSAAAYRYTEARMTEVAELLLDGLDEDAVDFRADLRRLRCRSRLFCLAPFPICSPMARPASRSAWRPRSRPTMRPSFATPRCISSRHPNADRRKADAIRPRPGFPDRRHHRRRPRDRSSRPTRPGAGSFRVRARWSDRGAAAAAPGRSSSPKFPIRCRRAG